MTKHATEGREGFWVAVGDGGEVECRIGPNPLEFFEDLEAAKKRCIAQNVAARDEDSDAYYSILQGDESGPYDRKKYYRW